MINHSPTPVDALKTNTLDFFIHKFGLEIGQKGPVEVRNTNRTIMAQLLSELGFKVGAEVGVAQGFHAEVLCQQNPEAKLYAVDVWEPYEGYKEYSNRIEKYYQEAKGRLSPYNCELIKKFSQDAAQDFADGSLDYVYIDGAHDFKNVAIDLCEWAKKVRIGGIVFGHDYNRGIGQSRVLYGVKDVVQAYVYVHNVRPFFVLANDLPDPKFGMDAPGWLFIRSEEDLVGHD